MSTATEAPAIGSHVRVSLLSSPVEFPARLVEQGGDVLVLSPPELRVLLLHRPCVDDDVVVAWTARGARYEMRCRVTGIETDGGWRLLRTGFAERVQRRAYVRAGLVSACAVGWNGNLMTGLVLDLSEAGMRVRVVLDVPPVEGELVSVELPRERGGVEVSAEVTRVRRDDPGSVELGLRFLDTGPVADRLRKQVFAFLLRERALRA